MARSGWPLVVVTAALCGVALLGDAATFSLVPADPRTGRERGCYTIVESLLGLKRPFEVARFGQALVGGTLLVVPLAARRWRKSGSVRPSQQPQS
jgi:hypothetical protein